MPFTHRYFLAVRFSFADFNLSYSRIVYVIIFPVERADSLSIADYFGSSVRPILYD